MTEALHIKGECGTLVFLRRAEVIHGSQPPGIQAGQRLFILILSRMADAFCKKKCTSISPFFHVSPLLRKVISSLKGYLVIRTMFPPNASITDS